MLNYHKFIRTPLIIASIIVISAIFSWELGLPNQRVTIFRSGIEEIDKNGFTGFAEISKKDLESIIYREFYVRAKIYSCGNERDYYPTDIYYQGVMMDNLNGIDKILSEDSSEIIKFSYYVPINISNQYLDPCIKLYGGQMVGFGKVISNPVKIDAEPR